MPNYGTSAYIKLISLNPKPQRTEIRKRLSPSDTPYDFHRSLRIHANRLLARDESLEGVLDSVSRIVKTPERTSVQTGLAALLNWRTSNMTQIFDVKRHVQPSPNGTFNLSFSPDFGTVIENKRCAVHLWNTKNPALSQHLTVGTLSMLKASYPEVDNLVVLNLVDSHIVWSSDDVRMAAVGRNLMSHIENVISVVAEEIRSTSRSRHTPPGPSHPLA